MEEVENPFPTLKDALRQSWHEFQIACIPFYNPVVSENLSALYAIMICKIFGG